MTAWWREGEVPILWTLPRGFRDVQLSPRIVFTAPLSECIVIEKRILLRVRSASNLCTAAAVLDILVDEGS